MTELLGLGGVFLCLMAIGKVAIMGLDDRRSLMLRPIPVSTERGE